jgi:hypothetical protein
MLLLLFPGNMMAPFACSISHCHVYKYNCLLPQDHFIWQEITPLTKSSSGQKRLLLHGACFNTLSQNSVINFCRISFAIKKLITGHISTLADEWNLEHWLLPNNASKWCHLNVQCCPQASLHNLTQGYHQVLHNMHFYVGFVIFISMTIAMHITN